MADSAYDPGEEERTLGSLLGALKTCLIAPRTRAEKIAGLDLWNYRHHFEMEGYAPDEADSLARIAFDDDVDRAEGVLVWRAIVVADLVGEAMAGYARTRSLLDDPWMAWRNDPPDEVWHFFVRGLGTEEFLHARVAYHAHSSLNVRRPSRVPTDGDLEDVRGFLKTEYGSSWSEWMEILGRPPAGVDLRPAVDAAKRDLERVEGKAGTEALLIKIAELTDMVSAFQMPIIERLESMGAKLDTLGAPDRFRAEEFLKAALGDRVYLSLTDDTRTALLEAERGLHDPGTVDWNSVVSGYTKAFEIQIKQVILAGLAKRLKGEGVMTFPDHELMPNRDPRVRREKKPIIMRGKLVDNLTLGMISVALTSDSPQLSQFGKDLGLDLSGLKRRIDGLIEDRNEGAHETGMTVARAQRLRDDWLGVGTGDGGIFGALVPRGLI
jgi:hypothetical protein